MKSGKRIASLLIPLMLMNSFAVSASAASAHEANKQSVIDQVSREYQVSRDLIQQELNKGYFIEEIRKALALTKKSGKQLDEALTEVGARAVPASHGKASVSKTNPAKTETEASAKKRLQTALTSVTTAATTVDSSQIDFNKSFDQAPFTIPAGQDSFSTLTGSTYVNNTDLTLPGRNGLNFVLKREYDSESAQLFDVDYTASPLKTSIKYDMTRNYMGPGWRFDIPSMEIKTSPSTSYIMHLPGGGSYTADLTYNKLIGYPWKDITVRRDTTSDSGGNGFYLSSTTDNLKYFFESTGKLKEIKDLFGNTISFTYSSTLVNYLDFTEASSGAANAGYPLTQITNSMGNTMSFSYLPATSTDPQKMVVKTGNQTFTYKFTSRSFPTNTADVTQTAPLLTEVDDPLGDATLYNYEQPKEDNAWSQTTGTNQKSTRNPYSLVTSVVHPTGATTTFTYPDIPATIISGTTANDIFPVTTIYDQFTKSDGTTETDNRLSMEYNGNMCRLMDDGTFKTIVTDDLGRVSTYQYKKDSIASSPNPNVPFFKMVTKTEDKGDTVDTTSYTYDETNKYPSPLTTQEVISSKKNTSKTVTLNSSRTYDAYSNVKDQTNALGQTVSNTFDATYHWLTKQITYLTGNSSTSGSVSNQAVYTRNNTTGAVTRLLVTDQTGATLRDESYTYDSYGNVTKNTMTDTGSKTISSTNTYDPSNTYLSTVSAQFTDADGHVSTSTKTYVTDTATGKVKQSIDARNNMTSYTYDNIGRLTKVSNPDNTSVSMTYDDSHNQIEMDQYAGTTIVKRVLNKWDPLGRKIESGLYAETGDYQAKEKYQYNAYGRQVLSEDAMGNATSITYDLSDRKTAVTYQPDNSTTTFQYDDVNQTQTVTTPDGYASRSSYDNGGRVTEKDVLTASGAQMESVNTYDFAGNVLSAKDANGNLTTYTYDALSELTNVVTPDHDRVTYSYDKRGNVTQLQDGSGYTVQKVYDELGAVVSETKNNISVARKYYYDANHNLVRQVDPTGQVTLFEYDSNNQLTKSTAGTDIISYQYDALGRRTQMTDATGTTQYVYTTNDNLSTVQLPDGKTITYAYDADGNRLSMKDPFDQTVYYQYNVKNEVQSVTSGNSGNPDANYAFTAGGMLQSGTLGNGMTSAYTYDDHGRVASLQQTMSNHTLTNSYQHTYDANGNLTGRTVNNTSESFAYDSMNRIKSSSQFKEAYSYDSGGDRLTLQSDQLVLPTTNTYEYNARNQLKKATTADGKTVTYMYNGDGLLYQRTENGVTTRYYYDGDRMIAEATVVNGTPTLKARYLYDGSNKVIARVDVSGTKAYYSYNSHGDVSELRDANGTVLNSYTYDIWGNPLTSNETVSNPFRYTGEFWDSTASLVYLRARWYDPSQGRFINEDTYQGKLDTPQSENLYVYVLNNPLTQFDPSGHIPTVDEAAAMADNIYDGSVGDQLTGGWELLSIATGGDDMKIGVYARVTDDGSYEYSLVSKGTTATSLDDWENNILQPFGASPDMDASVDFATSFVKQHSNSEITFVGHSKGGAEAAANAIATNKNAILFNPSTVNLSALGLDTSNYTSDMTAYIVKGEILNQTEGKVSVPIGDVVYLPNQYPVDTWNPYKNISNSIKNHLMGSVKAALREWEGY